MQTPDLRPRPEDAAATAEPGAPTLADAVAASPLTRGLEELQRQFGPLVGPDAVESVVFESLSDMGVSGTDPSHREDLAVRFARARLEALAELEGADEGEPAPRVLFVCVQNAGRSQLAAALLTEKAQDAVVVASAGSRPSSEIHGTVAPVLDAMGADLSALFPKPVAPELLCAADYVITMGCGESLEVPEGTQLRDWPVGDPAEADAAELERIVQDIEGRVDALWAELRRD